MKNFPNGFNNWQETHFDVVAFITLKLNDDVIDEKTIIAEVEKKFGSGGIYQLAEEWTDLFELKFENILWGVEFEYFEEIEEFLHDINLIK